MKTGDHDKPDERDHDSNAANRAWGYLTRGFSLHFFYFFHETILFLNITFNLQKILGRKFAILAQHVVPIFDAHILVYP